MTDRSVLFDLVERLVTGAYASDAEVDRLVAEFAAAVPHPRASDLIFYWEDEFDEEPTPEQIVARALSYRPIEL
ncbi:bacteriocin immunity protein [Pimelobacter simplex]|uniref:bacteriocin immunity protein n=1 Tax=Nocardioides simplex TaxID=2045 RepID=UPI001931F5A7|nr:bacteriocin immunity protein [Pimelobacter simplex]